MLQHIPQSTQYFRTTVSRINKSAHNLCSICIYNLVRIRSNTIDSKCTPFDLYDKFNSILCKIRFSIFSLRFWTAFSELIAFHMGTALAKDN